MPVTQEPNRCGLTSKLVNEVNEVNAVNAVNATTISSESEHRLADASARR